MVTMATILRLSAIAMLVIFTFTLHAKADDAATEGTSMSNNALGNYVSQKAQQTINDAVPNVQLVGEGKMTYYFWDVYDARLFAPKGQWNNEPPYALALTYLRDFDGKDIAERSIKEMKKQGFNDSEKLREWEETMKSVFPNVEEGETLTGVFTADGKTLFIHDDELIGTVEEKGFGTQFFAIWLSEKTSEPKLREKLVGG